MSVRTLPDNRKQAPDNPVLVTIIIVNWNGRSWLEKCLPSLATQTFDDFQIVVVDNGSRDGSVDWLQRHWPQVRVLAQAQNLGFAAANNLAILKSHSDFIVMLNNDTQVEPEWLAALVAAAEHPNVGMVASQIVLWNQPHLLDSAGIEVDRAGIAWNRGWQQPAAGALRNIDVFGPAGAAALYRRTMLQEIGLFDEDFFAFYEDVDLAWRAQRAGWNCRYEPAALVYHWHSATAGKMPEQKAFLLGRNKLWAILKNYDWPAILWAWPLILFMDATAAVSQAISLRSLAPIKGRLQAICQARKMVARRTPSRRAVRLAPLTSSRYLAGPLPRIVKAARR